MKAYQLLLSLLFIFNHSLSAAEWELIRSGNFTLPYGISATTSPFTFNPPVKTDRLAIRYSGSYCDDTVARAYQIRVRYTPNDIAFETLVPVDGVFTIPEGSIYQLHINVSQEKYNKVSCTESLYKAGSPSSATGSLNEYTFIGLVELKGTKATVELPIIQNEKLTHLWIEVPQYCRKNLQIKKVETKTNNNYYPATQVDLAQHIFQIEEGEGSRISQVRIDLSSSAELTCYLGVYGKQKRED